MSSIDVSSLLSTISSMEQQLASLRAQLSGSAKTSASVPVSPAPAEKKQRKKRNGPPTAWVLFSDRVREVLRTNGYAKSDLGIRCVQFCSSLKDENAEFSTWVDADILARRAAWTAPTESKQAAAGIHYVKGKKVVTPPGSTTGSVASVAENNVVAPVSDAVEVVSDGGSAAKKRKPWSAETKAAAKAKRDAKKDAKKAAATTTSSNTTTTEAVALPLLPPSPPETVVTSEFKGVMLGGGRYLVDLNSGHCYKRAADGSQGDWAGIFHRSGGPKGGSWIDDSVAEPDNDSDSSSDSDSDSNSDSE